MKVDITKIGGYFSAFP